MSIFVPIWFLSYLRINASKWERERWAKWGEAERKRINKTWLSDYLISVSNSTIVRSLISHRLCWIVRIIHAAGGFCVAANSFGFSKRILTKKKSTHANQHVAIFSSFTFRVGDADAVMMRSYYENLNWCLFRRETNKQVVSFILSLPIAFEVSLVSQPRDVASYYSFSRIQHHFTHTHSTNTRCLHIKFISSSLITMWMRPPSGRSACDRKGSYDASQHQIQFRTPHTNRF